MDTIRVIVDSVNAVVNVADTVKHTANSVNHYDLDSTSIMYICIALTSIVFIICFSICLIHLIRGTRSVKCILVDILKNPEKEISTQLIELITKTIKEKVDESSLKKEEKNNE